MLEKVEHFPLCPLNTDSSNDQGEAEWSQFCLSSQQFVASPVKSYQSPAGHGGEHTGRRSPVFALYLSAACDE